MTPGLCSRIGAALALLAASVLLNSVGYAQGLQVGYATVTASGSGRTPVGTALFTFNNAEGVLVWEAGVGAAEAIRSGRIFVDQQGTRTAVAFVNPSTQSVTATLILRNASGSELSRQSQTFTPGQNLALYVDELFSLPAGFTGSLTFEGAADQKLAAITLRESLNERGEAIFATLPVIDLSSAAGRNSVVFPHIGAGGGLSTQIVLVSRSGDPISGQIQLFSSEGASLALQSGGTVASQFAYQIEPHGTFRLDLGRSGDTVAGYAVVTLEQGSATPSGSALFQIKSAEGKLLSEAGVAASAPTTRARIFVDTAGTSTGVAIASPGNPAGTANLELLDRNGISIEKSSVSLPARGHRARFVGDLFSLPQGFTGLMEITSAVPFVPITLKLTVNSRGHPILTTLPVADLDNLPTAASVVFPRLGFGSFPGGRFSTRLILINTDKTGQTAGTLAFFQTDGSTLTVPLGSQTAGSFPYQIVAGGGRQLRPGNTAQVSEIFIDPLRPESNEITVSEGSSIRLRPLVIDTEGLARDDFDLSYQTIDPEVATVDALGKVDGKKAGFSSLTVTAGGVLKTGALTVYQITAGVLGFEITGVAQDLARRLYLASTRDHTILLAEDLTKNPQRYAGTSQTPGLKDDARLNSLFQNPAFLAFHQAEGTLFVADASNHAIRRVLPGAADRVETLAGTGQPGGQDGALDQATFSNPQGLALDSRGNLWVVDSGNHTIRRINLVTRSVETIAGRSGSPGQADGVGQAARFRSPVGIALETEPLARQLERELKGEPPPPVSVIVADTGNGLIRRVRENGEVQTIAGTFPSQSRARSKFLVRAATSQPTFNSPTGVAVDPFGNIYVTEPGSRELKTILRTGEVVRVAGAETFSGPRGLAITEKGKVIVADSNRLGQQITFGEPAISGIAPDRISNRGGMTITIKGSNFARETLVVAGGVVIPNIQIQDTQTISFVAPPLPSGQLTVTVQNRGGLAQKLLLVDPVPLKDLDSGQITTVAGGAIFSGDGSAATSATIAGTGALVVDAAGNLLVADLVHGQIRKVDARTGVITSVAGTGQLAYSGDGGPATAAALRFPLGLAIDRAGNIFIADTTNFRIRKVDARTGIIETFAGNGEYGFSGDNGPATAAALTLPSALALDPAGNLFFVDGSFLLEAPEESRNPLVGNHRIRKVDAETGGITTVAGNGEAGFSGDGGPASEASLNLPGGIACDADGNLFIADTFNHRIRKVDAKTGIITTIAGTGEDDFSGDQGPAARAALSGPAGVAFDVTGALLIADTGNARIRKIDPSGIIATIAGTGDFGFSGDGKSALAAELSAPVAVSADAAGNLFIADAVNLRIRKVSAADGIISTFAGNGELAISGDNGPATAAALGMPDSMALDVNGDLLFADSLLSSIRRISFATGIIQAIAGTGKFEYSGDNGPATQAALDSPQGVAVDAFGHIYIADTDNHVVRAILASSGQIITVAGDGDPDFFGDGFVSLSASLNEPSGLAIDSQGNLYIADTANHRIRKVDASTLVITTIAGDGDPAFSGDGGPAVEASLNGPLGVAVDSKGNVFVADTDNHRIRKIDAQTGIIDTVAGSLLPGFDGDGGPATSASLLIPGEVIVDAGGNLFIADSGNSRVRRVDAATGIITTVAGNGETDFSGDNGPATAAALNFPQGLVLDSQGNLYISDWLNRRIRAVKGPIK